MFGRVLQRKMCVVMAGAPRRRAGEGRESRPPPTPRPAGVPPGSARRDNVVRACGAGGRDAAPSGGGGGRRAGSPLRWPPHPRGRGPRQVSGAGGCPRPSPRFDASSPPGRRGREALCGCACRAKRGPAPGPLRGAAAAVTEGGGGVGGCHFPPSGVQSPARSGCGRFSASCRKLHPFGAQLIGKLLGIIC